MDKINQFSIQRLFLLMKRHSIINLKTWLVGLGAISGVLIVISLLQSYSSGLFNLSALSTTGVTFIFIAGYLITSMAYNEIHTPARGQFYLMLPANTIEKLLSNWLITSFLYIIIATVFLTVILALASLLSSFLFNTGIEIYNPFTNDGIKIMGIYVVTQSVFFLGALYFRKNNLLKTLLGIFVIQGIFSIIMVFAGWLILGEFNQVNEESIPADTMHFFTVNIPEIARTIFWVVTAPFFLIVSYFKLKEREV